MAFDPLQAILDGPVKWKTIQQFALLAYLAWRQHEPRFGGFSQLEVEKIAERLCLSDRRVYQLLADTAALPTEILACLGQKNRQQPARYRVQPNGPPELPGELFPIDYNEDVPGVKPIAPRGVKPIAGRGLQPIAPRGLQPVALSSSIDRSLVNKIVHSQDAPAGTRPAPAAPRLPSLITTITVSDEERANAKGKAKRRRDRLRGKTYRKVARLARRLLHNDAFAREWNAGAPIAGIGELVDALKWMCASSGLNAYDVIDGAATSELFKKENPDVVNGNAPRPRDLRGKRGAY